MHYNLLFEELAANNSRLFKEAKMMEFQNDLLLKKIFFAALDPFTNYYIRKIPDYNWTVFGETYTLEEAVDRLDALKRREVTGNAAAAYLKDILEKIENTDAAEVIIKIIKGERYLLWRNSTGASGVIIDF